MEDNIIKVYVKVDNNNVIKEINSSIFIQDLTGWTQIDEGQGDKYSHAQGNYFPKEKGLMDNQFKYNYKLVDGKVAELTDEEKEKLFPTKTPEPTKQELLENQLLETQAILASLQEQILLKSNGGM